jgi:hypothetical protein
MANPVKSLDELRRLAERQLKATTGWSDFQLVHRQNNQGRGAEPLHEFVAVRPTAPNAPSKSLFLDAEGKPAAPVRKAAAPSPAKPRLARRLPCEPVTVSPDTNRLVLCPGDTLSETLTVHIPAEPCCKADIYFLTDLTGSISTSLLDEIALNFGNIAAQLGAGGCDLAYGAGFYKDFGSDITNPADVFVNLQGISANPADAQNALNLYTSFSGGGDDYPEAQFYAFDRLANDPVIGWRSGARKMVVWIGDAPGHDPVCAGITGLGYDITETHLIDPLSGVLVTNAIRVLALSIGSPALDDDPLSGNASYTPWGCVQNSISGAGQASRIAAATYGAHVSGLDQTTLVPNIINLLSWALSTYGSVALVASGGTAAFLAPPAPVSYGPFDLGTVYDLPFDVVFTGVEPCSDVPQVFTGTIDVVVDGVVMAQKTVEITVPVCDECGVPRPSCIEAAAEAGKELLEMAQDKTFYMTATPGCSGITDPVFINEVCQPLDFPDVHPCFFIKWGDGKRDQIETEDFEVLLLTICNPYSNVTFGHLNIPKIEVTDAAGNTPPLLPDGSESVMLVPSRMICFDEIPPCSCRSFELVLKTCGAPEGPYKIKFSYCADICIHTGIKTQEFDFELVTS